MGPLTAGFTYTVTFAMQDALALDAIAEYGFIVTGVGGLTNPHGVPEWAYTLGLLDARWSRS